MSTGLQQTRDEIGTEDSTSFIFKKFSEKARVSEGPVRKIERDISSTNEIGLILNHEFKSYFNINYIGSPFAIESLLSVESFQDSFRESFDFTEFLNISNTTADTSTLGQVDFTTSEVLESEVVAKDTRTFTKATLISIEEAGNYLYEMSADGGINWDSVDNGVQHTFTNTGTEIKYRITLSGTSSQFVTSDGEDFITSDGENLLVISAAGAPRITEVRVLYS